MARILLAWELGTGYGHAARLKIVGDALAAAGHDLIFAVRHIDQAAGILGYTSLVQAPSVNPERGGRTGPVPVRSYNDILHAVGFTDPACALPILAAWETQLSLIRPDLVVADSSPFLALALFGRCPLVTVGDGYTQPPLHLDDMPLLDLGPTDPGSVSGSGPGVPTERILEAIDHLQTLRGQPVPSGLPALLGGQRQFVCTLPELDPYADLRLEPALGPLTPLPSPLPPPLAGHPPGTPPGAFVYLGADYPPTARAMEAILSTGVPVTVHLRRAPAALRERLRARGAVVHDAPPPLDAMLAASAVVVHHGGSATAASALAAGRPQLIVGQHLEHRLNAAALDRQGVSRDIAGADEAEAAGAVLADMLRDEALAGRAAAAARRISDRRDASPVAGVLQACTELAA